MTETELTEAGGLCAGVRVVELAEGMAGPMATMILADHGADVVKVEFPTGDWARRLPAFAFWNRGKRSVVIDPEVPDGPGQLRSLLAGADVFVVAPYARIPASLDIGYETVSRENPALVYCSIDGFGRTVRPDNRPASEAAVAAATGRMNGVDRLSGGLVPPKRDGPVYIAPSVGSYGAAQLAVQAILATLMQRSKSGLGDHIETDLVMGASAFLMRQEMIQEKITIQEQVRRATIHRGIELCFLTAECADGAYIQMCARQDHHFRNWMRALGIEEIFGQARFAKAPMGIATIRDVDELEDLIRVRMRTRPGDEWMRRFIEQFDVGADPFFTSAQFLHHEQMTANGQTVVIDDPEWGHVVQLGSLAKCASTPAAIGTPAPRLGQHSGQVLAGLSRAAAQPAMSPPSSDDDSASTPYPLAGVTILELAYFIAGPMATSALAELGARVIKVEPLTGDPYRRTGIQAAKFLHGKESIALDLKSEAGQQIVYQLVKRSNAFIHNFRPGVMDRLKMDYPSLRAINDQLIYVNATSYGSLGSQANRIAFHSTGNALTGGGIIQAGAGNPPVDDSFPDPASALGAATAMILGLFGQQRGSGGQEIETMMLTSSGYVLSPHMVVKAPDDPPRVLDGLQLGYTPADRLYRCADGWVCVSACTTEEERALRRALDVPDDLPDVSMAAALEAQFAGGRASEWTRSLGDKGVPIVIVDERTFDTWLVENGIVIPEDNPVFGAYFRLPAKVRFSRQGSRFSPPPTIGGDTESILLELGLGPAEVGTLFERGVLGGPRAVAAKS
jgi:crotonobetainyl-CoA:carnitine CoA-transferase CaiB-like acyl-CoA transferase